MKIHRYFFWIEDNFIEIYKDGKLERYDGDFTFLVDEKTDRENLLNSIEKYNYEIDLSPEFSSEDLKKILDIKNIKKVIFNYNNEEITIAKTEEKYMETEFEDELTKIFILGNNINEDILKEISNQRVEKKEKKDYKLGRLGSYFKKKEKTRER